MNKKQLAGLIASAIVLIGIGAGFGFLGARGGLSFGNRIGSDEKAKNAVTALTKLAARTQSGISYRDYSPALGDAYFPVKVFLESDSAKSNQEFTQAVTNSMKWFHAASEVWSVQFEYDIVGSTTCKEPIRYKIPELCKSYPELTSMVKSYRLGLGEEVTGIRYKDAIQKSWELAGEELRKAVLQMK